MKTLALALSIALAISAPALACTSEELQTKATDLTIRLQELVAKDPVKAGEVGQKMAAIPSDAATDLDGACKFYDDLLAEIEAAE